MSEDTITITISRKDAEAMRHLRVNGDRKSFNAIRRMQFACFAALLPEADLGHEQAGERFCDICHGEAQR